MIKFDRPVAFVTGASSGIGEAICLELSKRGAIIVLFARRREKLTDVKSSLVSSIEQDHLVIDGDVRDQNSLLKAFELAINKYGKINIVVANAGFGVLGEFDELDVADYRRQFETNVFGVLNTIKASLPFLKKTNGCLTIIGSVGGYVPLKGSSAYSMSKSSLHTLARVLRKEFSKFKISVTLAVPACVKTEIWNVDKFGNYNAENVSPSVPEYFLESKKVAARAIVLSTINRKNEVYNSIFSKVLILFWRVFPYVSESVVEYLLRRVSRSNIKFESQNL